MSKCENNAPTLKALHLSFNNTVLAFGTVSNFRPLCSLSVLSLVDELPPSSIVWMAEPIFGKHDFSNGENLKKLFPENRCRMLFEDVL